MPASDLALVRAPSGPTLTHKQLLAIGISLKWCWVSDLCLLNRWWSWGWEMFHMAHSIACTGLRWQPGIPMSVNGGVLLRVNVSRITDSHPCSSIKMFTNVVFLQIYYIEKHSYQTYLMQTSNNNCKPLWCTYGIHYQSKVFGRSFLCSPRQLFDQNTAKQWYREILLSFKITFQL